MNSCYEIASLLVDRELFSAAGARPHRREAPMGVLRECNPSGMPA